MDRSLMALVALLAFCASDCLAQATLAPGESRANAQQYLASHNSYQGGISLTSALDTYNVWSIELDVRWREDGACLGGPTGFYILHYCGDPDGEGFLVNRLLEIAGTNRIQEGFFFLGLELGDGYVCLGCFEGPLFPSDYVTQLETMLLGVFGSSAVYTWQDLVADGYQWPSVQELVRRGKHVAIQANIDDGASTVLFKRANAFGFNPPIAWWNTDDENKVIPDTGDRFMTRRYPEAYCVLEDGAAWVTAYNNGFNFPDTNCIDFHAVNNRDFFQPPHPSHAAPTGSGSLGTVGSPHVGGAGLVDACSRASFYNALSCPGAACKSHPTPITIEMDPGTYTASGASAAVLDCPVVLTAPDGAATVD